jgi:predicted permease
MKDPLAHPVPRKSAFPPAPTQAAEAEIEHHLAELVERLQGEGFSREDATAEALRRFGDPATYRGRLARTEHQRRRKMRRIEAWTLLKGAVVQTVRTTRRHPGYAAGVIVTLGLGVGANAAMFGILDRLLFQPPLHVVEHEQVKRVVIGRDLRGAQMSSASIAFPDFLDLKGHQGLAAVAPVWGSSQATLGSGPDATRVLVTEAGYELFPLLGVAPELGRFFGEEDDREDAPLTAVVSREYWKRAMGGTSEALGRTLELDGKTFTVVGVAPAGFTGVDLEPVDVWIPIRANNAGDQALRNRGSFWLNAVVRLADGEDVTAAEEQATALHRAGRQTEVDRGRYDADARVSFRPLIAARGPDASAESTVARWLGGVSLIVLIIACANVANLLLARGTRRRREVSLRMALGAERPRLIAFLVGESVLLALLGGLLALAIATWGGAAIRRVLLPGVSFPGPAVDGRLLLFTAIAALVAGAASAFGPALQSTRSDLARELTGSVGSSSRRSRTRALLTAGQAALAAVLLAGAGLFVKSVAEVRRLDLGLDVDRLSLVTLEVSSGAADQNDLYRRAMDRLREVPGVVSVVGTHSPFQWGFARDMIVAGFDSLPDMPGGGPYYQWVTDGYFETMGLRITEGRTLAASDGPRDPRVAVISTTMAKTLWPDRSSLGECLYIAEGERRAAEVQQSGDCTRIVGVVEDASRGSLEEETHMAYYLPFPQTSEMKLAGLYVRTEGDAHEVAGASASALRTLDPAVRFVTAATLREHLDPQARSWTLGATMFTIFGLLALVVAAIGLYSVLAFDVAQSTREIGIRTALGAERRRLLAGVLLRGVRMAVAGVVVGLAIAVAAAPYATELLFHVSPRDPFVLGGAAAFLLTVALAASLLPGLRATRVDAMEALRTD